MVCCCRRFRASSLEELQEQVTQKYVLSNISTLTTYGMVETSYSSSDPTHAQQQQQQQQQVQVLKPLQPGRIMAQNFLRLGTMVEIAKEQPRPGMSALLGIVCRAEEFRNITLRRYGHRMGGLHSGLACYACTCQPRVLQPALCAHY
jgi:hypothetical protein